MELSGCFVAIVTPFRDGAVDGDALAAHATWLVDGGVSGIVVCGTTGESATLTDEEKIFCANTVFDAVAERATVVVGAGNNCTAESVEFVSRFNEEARAHAIMSVVPYYNKPNQRGLVGHFEAVADRSRFPVVIYNVPGRTVISMTVATMVELSSHPNIVAIKEASANLHMDALLLDELPEDIALFSGDDATAMPLVAMGGAGVISVVGNVAPRLMSDMCRAAASGDLPTARRLNGRVARAHELMFRYPNPLPAKLVAEKLGFGSATPRLPIAPLDAKEREDVLASAAELGLFD